MFNGYSEAAAFARTIDNKNSTLQYEKIPEIYLPPSYDSNTMSNETDFIFFSEFSEQEGPKPLLCIPSFNLGEIDLNKLSLQILSVDHQSNNSLFGNAFKMARDTYCVINYESPLKVSALVYHFTLYDFAARGFVRPFCLSYVSTNKRKIIHLFEELSEVFSKVVNNLRTGNLNIFTNDLNFHLKFLQSIKESESEFTENMIKYQLNFKGKTFLQSETLRTAEKSEISCLVSHITQVLHVVNQYRVSNNISCDNIEDPDKDSNTQTKTVAKEYIFLKAHKEEKICKEQNRKCLNTGNLISLNISFLKSEKMSSTTEEKFTDVFINGSNNKIKKYSCSDMDQSDGNNHYFFKSFVEGFHDKSTTENMLRLLNFININLHTAPHVLFCLLTSRPLIVIGMKDSEDLILNTIKMFSLFSPGIKGSTPPRLHIDPITPEDFQSANIIGVSCEKTKDTFHYIPTILRKCLSIFDLTTSKLHTPYYKGKLLVKFCEKSLNKSESLFYFHFIRFIHELSKKAFVCAYKQAKCNKTYTVESTYTKVNDIEIFKNIVYAIKEQLTKTEDKGLTNIHNPFSQENLNEKNVSIFKVL